MKERLRGTRKWFTELKEIIIIIMKAAHAKKEKKVIPFSDGFDAV